MRIYNINAPLNINWVIILQTMIDTENSILSLKFIMYCVHSNYWLERRPDEKPTDE